MECANEESGPTKSVILARVVDHQRPGGQEHATGYALPRPETPAPDFVVVHPLLIGRVRDAGQNADVQTVGLQVVEHDGALFGGGDLDRLAQDVLQQFFQVADVVDGLADVVEQGEVLKRLVQAFLFLLALGIETAGVDADGRVGGDLAQEIPIGCLKRPAVAPGPQGQQADDLAAHDQGQPQHGAQPEETRVGDVGGAARPRRRRRLGRESVREKLALERQFVRTDAMHPPAAAPVESQIEALRVVTVRKNA